jgi:hypothetical protein
MLVYDPINLENIPIDDYLDNDANNIVVIYNNKAYGVNKALFMFNNEMKRCIIANAALLKKATYDNPETFYNIGYFIGKKVIVNQNTLNDVLKEHRIVELTSKNTEHTYINKELLELTTIGLIKPSSKKSVGKVNFKHAREDVYFDELISKILHEYSGSLFAAINFSLLNPEHYNNDKPSEYYYYDYNKPLHYNYNYLLFNVLQISKKNKITNLDFKKGLDNAITNIDRGFIEAAPRFEKTYVHNVFYRGMKEKYITTNGNELENIGDIAIIKNYTSVSSNKSVAKKFAGNLVGKKTPIYIIYLEEGLPFINMVSTAKIKKEKEYLLPRNIIFELISKKGREYTVIARPFKKDQFAIRTGCFPLDTYDIQPASLPLPVSPATLSSKMSSKKSAKLSAKLSVPSPAKSKTKSNIDSGNSDKSKKDNVKPVKLKRCPNGMVRIKMMNECVPKQNIKPKAKPKAKPDAKPEAKAKMARCPKGTRRNPKTLKCEAKQG